ncbi:hypothetical protein [Algirhabdus cladophorae]|uniref:hypothetical protein n=1 Tax=Algirhabdus cladophorae TaxID=3377108 RepID=UPI003B84B4A7
MEIPSALIRQVRRDLIGPHGATTNDFKAFVASQRYTPDSTQPLFQLRPYDADELVAGVSGDCSRFGRATCETLAGIASDPRAPKNAAWFVVRTYYAAFYSAHAFLRLFGRLCSNIDGAELARLRQACNAVGQTPPSKGFYEVSVSSNLQTLAFAPLKNSHEDTWATLTRLIDELRTNTASVAAPKQSRDDTIVLLSAIIANLSDNQSHTKGNFLSHFRNQVQYRFAHQAWYPYGAKHFPTATSPEDMVKSVLDGRYQDIIGNTELVRFTNAAMQFIQLVIQIVDASATPVNQVSRHLTRDYVRIRNIYK